MKLHLKRGLTFFCLPALFLIEGAGFLSGCLDVVVGVPVPDDFRGYAVHGVFKPRLLQSTLPDDDDIPALGFQLAPNFLVTLLVPGYLGCPKVSVCLGNRVVLAALMAMPEAAVDEDDSAVFGEDDVGGAGKAFVIHAVAEPQAPQCTTQLQLRLRRRGVNGRHVFVALFFCEGIWHYRTCSLEGSPNGITLSEVKMSSPLTLTISIKKTFPRTSPAFVC